MTEYVEQELKLLPSDEGLLDVLERVDHVGPMAVSGRRRELQANAFFDTRERALREQHVGFRRRNVEGHAMATWSIKGDARRVGAVASRSEIELQLEADTAPALALNALRDAARTRGAAALAEAVSDALRGGALPMATPVLETRTDRRILDLTEPRHGWEVELALDRVELVGHAYREVEIEAELKRGDLSALDAVHSAIAALGAVSESHGSKLSRAQAHLDACHC